MLVQIQDQAALASLPIVNLRAYLHSRGWRNEGPWGTRPATIYVKEYAGRDWDILLPLRDTVADYAESMARSIAVLATVEGRSQLDLFLDVKAAGADVIRVHSTNGSVGESLSLRRSASLLNDAYNMLSSAARAVDKPQPAYRGKLSSDVAEYLDNVWPVPGYHEGYSLTLHSPVPAGVGVQQDFGDDYHSPFSRRATYKLAQALQHTDAAISQAVADDTLEPFELAVNHGVSANLCDSVAEMARQGHGIEIQLIWAGIRPSNNPASHFQFSANSSDILIEAAKSFRQNDPSYDEQVVAQVVQLDREPDEFDGRATILCTRDERPVRIKVEFDKSVYDLVIKAFQEHEPVTLIGDIYRVGTGYELKNPRNLTLT